MIIQSTHPGGARGSSSYRGKGHFNQGRGSYAQHICTHCGHNNHTVETCFIKDGYPPGYNYKSNKSFINNVEASPSPETPMASPQDTYPIMYAIQNQYDHIIQLLQHHSISPSPVMPTTSLPNMNSISTSFDGKPHVYWVVDTGVTHHITHSLNNFSSYSHVSPITMKLPNGFTVLTGIAGTVYLFQS